jgi:hypothetical protein
MEPDGDPEARVRDLEPQPYAATTPPPPLSAPYPAQPYGQYGTPQYTSPYYAAPQRVVRKRSHTAALWLIPLAVVAIIVTGIAGAVVYLNLGSPDTFTENPIAGGGGSLDEPQPPAIPTLIEQPEQVIAVEAGGSISIGGIERNQTVICDQGAVNISGVNNTVEIQGSCASVTVSGIENVVTVESAGTISASGFDNRVTYRSGAPEISTSGTGNTVEPG